MKQDHINDLKEWQEKQYLPGYYVGAKIPPILKQRTKGLAVSLIAIGTFFVLLALGIVFSSTGDSLWGLGWYGVVGLIFLAAGISVARQLQKKPQKSHKRI